MTQTGTASDGVASPALQFHRGKHIRYFQSCLRLLPKHYMDVDSSRMTVIYFATVALDMLDALDRINAEEIIEYIYMLQVQPVSGSSLLVESGQFGFIGGTFTNHHLCGFCTKRYDSSSSSPLGTAGDSSSAAPIGREVPCDEAGTACDGIVSSSSPYLVQPRGETAATATSASVYPNTEADLVCGLFRYHQGHLAMTYTALVSLLTLGDNLSRVNRSNIIKGMKKLQTPEGSFYATAAAEGEDDVRFLYCACAISYILQDWTGVDCDRAVDYIKRCITYEGGMAVAPGSEAQGGATYCALASLKLMGRLESALTSEQRDDLIRWCEARQCGGYQGRTNKVQDSCYSFWVGGSLSLLGAFQDSDISTTRRFLLQGCQQQLIGGFSKYLDGYPDVLHSFYSICWLSMGGADDLKTLDVHVGACFGRIRQ